MAVGMRKRRSGLLHAGTEAGATCSSVCRKRECKRFPTSEAWSVEPDADPDDGKPKRGRPSGKRAKGSPLRSNLPSRFPRILGSEMAAC